MEENLEATQVAVVTDRGRMRLKWHGKTIVDISRDFLNTSGVKQNTDVKVVSPEIAESGKSEELSPLKKLDKQFAEA